VNLLKESRTVIDVVNFGYRIKGSLKDDEYKRDENLKALVDAVNDYNNENGDSRYFHIQDDGFSLSYHISTSPILPPLPSLLAEEEEARIVRRKAKIYPAILPPPSLVAEEEEEEELPPYHRDWWVEVVDSGW
ncbi:hypothetical protein Tco_0239275, partial [Tanacetum coccineum]